MEKYSAFRDPGTGIQPFLTPIPASAPSILLKALLPIGYVLGAIRTVTVLALLLLYLLLVEGVCLVFAPIPFVHRILTRIFTAIISRAALLLIGLVWLPVEYVTRKRGRTAQSPERWNPRAGDIIVSNWVSWIETLWLAFRFNPVFIIPVSDTSTAASAASIPSTPIAHTPGRRTGTASANISSPNRAPSTRIPILGFRQVSLLSMLRLTGRVPPFNQQAPKSLEEIRQGANRPIVVFPECTTSNGRGLLRFANVFKGENVPVKKYKVFVMCVRYDPPTHLAPSLALSIPAGSLNPLPHLFALTSALAIPTVSIRLLAPSESPGSPLFMVSDVVTSTGHEDLLSEVCATLISQIGKLKRTGMAWEDKVAFLEFFHEKQK